MQIVIAWVEESQQIVKHGRVDIGQSHTFAPILLPFACMWLNDGNDSDLIKARAFASKEGRTVLCYENEANPLETAKRDILSRNRTPTLC